MQQSGIGFRQLRSVEILLNEPASVLSHLRGQGRLHLEVQDGPSKPLVVLGRYKYAGLSVLYQPPRDSIDSYDGRPGAGHIVEHLVGVNGAERRDILENLSLIHISEPTRRTPISYAVFCLTKKTKPT